MALSQLNSVFPHRRLCLLRTLQRLVGNRCSAEDLVQETYLRVAQAIRSRPVEHLEPFIFQTARNLAFDHLRARRLRLGTLLEGVPAAVLDNIASPAGSPEQAAHAERALRRIDHRLGGLSARQQRVFALNRLYGCSYLEIAEHLQVSASTVQKDLKLAAAICMGAR